MSVFISYSHQDKDFATKLAFGLIERRAHIWLDICELKVGDSLIDKIQAALANARAVVFVLSKASVESEWCKQELSSGLIRELEEKRVVVLPVLKEDCDIPLFLRRKMYADFRSDFDRGLKQVLEALAGVTTEGLGRSVTKDYHTDWAVDWFYENECFVLRLTCVDHGEKLPYSVLSEINVTLNKAATARHQKYERNGLGWFGRFILVERLTEIESHKELLLLLEDQFPKELRFGIGDTKSEAKMEVVVRSRRLGEDTGKDILANVSSLLATIREAYRQSMRKLTAEETRKAAQILAGES